MEDGWTLVLMRKTNDSNGEYPSRPVVFGPFRIQDIDYWKDQITLEEDEYLVTTHLRIPALRP